MKTSLLAAAGVIVLVANGWAILGSWQNRREPRGGTVELTERELRLQRMPGESTVTVVRLEWDSLSDNSNRHRPQWLDQEKLAELGFDCSVALTDPIARQHYASMPAAEMFLVLEYAGDAWRKADSQGKTRSRLFVIDAGRDCSRLREKYSAEAGFILARGIVRLWLQDWSEDGRTRLTVPHLHGVIEGILPAQIFVPRPHSDLLAPFRRRDLTWNDETEPRFTARVSWGADFEPWIKSVRVP
jgi:hypothetical protein